MPAAVATTAAAPVVKTSLAHKVELYHSFEGFTYNVVLGSQLLSMLQYVVYLDFCIMDEAAKDMNKGLMANTHLSPLACVWASLQVLVGDVASGLRSVLYWSLGVCLAIQISRIVSCCSFCAVSPTFWVCPSRLAFSQPVSSPLSIALAVGMRHALVLGIPPRLCMDCS